MKTQSGIDSIDSVASVIVVGAFPPPVRGMPVVTERVYSILSEIASVRRIDLSTGQQGFGFWSRASRLPKVVAGLLKIAFWRCHKPTALYMSISNSLGQLYDIAFIGIARLRRMQLILHHHVYSYLDTRQLLTQAVVRLAGPKTIHITLSNDMARRLELGYGARRVCPISNAVFLSRQMHSQSRVRQTVRTVGFISNISEEKGIFDYLELLRAIAERGLPINGLLAGPFDNTATMHRVLSACKSISNVSYLGPKFGGEKDEFYRGIDVFVFPTRYRNEAEPIVCLEALAAGTPVIAYARGCIPEIVSSDCGLVVDPAMPFLDPVIEQLEKWLNDSTSFQAASRSASRRFDDILRSNADRWDALLRALLGAPQDIDRNSARTPGLPY